MDQLEPRFVKQIAGMGEKKQRCPKVSSFKRLIFRLVLGEMGVRQSENVSC